MPFIPYFIICNFRMSQHYEEESLLSIAVAWLILGAVMMVWVSIKLAPAKQANLHEKITSHDIQWSDHLNNNDWEDVNQPTKSQ